MKLSLLFALLGGMGVFIIYPILYRIERNYLNKHRKELVELLYGYDPWGTGLSWSDHLLMSGAAGSTFLICRVPRKDVQKKISSGEFKNPLAPNAFANGNYRKLRNRHRRLEKIVVMKFVVFFTLLICAGTGFMLKKFYGA